MKVAEFLKGVGFLIEDMEWGLKDIRMEILMKECLKEEKQMVKEDIYGIMMNSMRDSGLTDTNMVKVLGITIKENNIQVTGEIIKQMVKEFIIGLMVTDMKVIGWIS